MPSPAPNYASILTIGNAIVDVIAQATDDFVAEQGMIKNAMNLIDADRADQLYDAIGPATESSGGSAANTAAGIAFLGGSAGFIGKVGEDVLGRIFRHDIEAVGVDLHVAIDPQLQTACSYILVTPDKKRTMNTYLGASIELQPDDMNTAAIAAADIVYIEGYLYDAPSGPACWDKIVKTAKAAETKIAISLSDEWCVDRHRGAMIDFITNHTDIVMCNLDEAKLLFQTDKDNAITALRQIVSEAAITDGPNGSLAFMGEDMAEIDADHDVKVLDTTGAGDLYASGYLYARHQGAGLQDAIGLASITASEVISHIGARPQTDLKAMTSQQFPALFKD